MKHNIMMPRISNTKHGQMNLLWLTQIIAVIAIINIVLPVKWTLCTRWNHTRNEHTRRTYYFLYDLCCRWLNIVLQDDQLSPSVISRLVGNKRHTMQK